MRTRVVVAAIIKKGDHFLFGKKGEGVGPYPNKWLILGGGLKEDTEKIEDGLRREIMEEGGIEITNISHVDFSEDFAMKKGEMIHFIFLDFKADYLSGKERPGDDIAELRWVHKSELKDLDMSKPSLALFGKLGYF